MIYFSITTLTTIGFGDYTPRNNIERIIILFTLLFGVMIFSIIMQMFLEVIEKLNMVEKENEDADNLSKFIGLMTKFNHNRILETEHIRELEQFFDFYWKNDKMSWFRTEIDLRYFDELPESIQIEIFKGFLFKPFIACFKK